jgi:large subunit ribosomal protein L22e
MDISVFEKFLKEHIKVDDKTNNLGSTVTVSREGKAKLSVHSDVAMSKRYMKYLTKKCVDAPGPVARLAG